MKIPGLDDITANMNKFAEMLPVLESINNNLRVLAETEIRNSKSLNHTTRMDLLERLT